MELLCYLLSSICVNTMYMLLTGPYLGGGAISATAAPGPAVFSGPKFWEVYFLCAVCEMKQVSSTVLQQK